MIISVIGAGEEKSCASEGGKSGTEFRPNFAMSARFANTSWSDEPDNPCSKSVFVDVLLEFFEKMGSSVRVAFRRIVALGGVKFCTRNGMFTVSPSLAILRG